ncbi:MAG: response regulator [Lentisphaeria bacterium]|nr:response regulator [Lentisphaeria bacterium]NQZ67319.1 response regulator [Lentisphaeria bacterium]
MAHDFNNTLSSIMGSAELLEPYVATEEEAVVFQQMIIESAEHAATLTGSLLAFARSTPPSNLSLDLHKILNDTVKLLETTIDRRITLKTDLSANSTLVMGDYSRLQSVFMNIGINASHALSDGGTIQMSTKNLEVDAAACERSLFDIKPGPYLQVDIRDTGTGMSAATKARIFDPFFTTKKHGLGTGLGLSVVYGTIQQHSGSVEVDSELEKGTCFRILLPLTTNQTDDKFTIDNKLIRGAGRILVIDDEEPIRKIVKKILENLGYEVCLAENGKHGLDLFKDDHENIDLVLLDMVMPVMNGRDCLVEMHKVSADVRAILASGYCDDADIKAMKEHGLRAFISKPYRRAELSRILQTVLKN